MIAFALANWRWLLLAAVAAWGGWQYVGRIEAEQAIVDMKLKQLEDANATWVELNAKREDFEREVRKGFADLSTEIGRARADNAAYAAKVNANANSKRPLDPVERDALSMFARPAADKAGGRAVQPAAQPPPVR